MGREGGSGQDHGYLADEIIISPAASRPPLHSSVLTAWLILFSSTNIDSLGSFHLVPIKKALLIVLLLNLFCSCEKHPAASRNSAALLVRALRAVRPRYPPESALPAAVQGTGPRGCLSAEGDIRVVLGMRLQRCCLLLGDVALLLRASVSLFSLVVPDHFCNTLSS